MGVDLNWLGKEVFGQDLTKEEQQVFGFLTEKTFKKGEDILKDGQEGGSLYFIRSGKASVQNYNRYEGRVSIATLEEGDLLGEMSFFKNRRVSAQVKAEEDCVLYKMEKADMSALMKDHEDLAFTVMQAILNHESKIIISRGQSLAPLLRQITDKAAGLPLAVKVLPIAFIVIYCLALLYTQFKDFEY
ncbi:MAG: Crp/Fnr family transcriptional regulator [Mariprofundaceae bacterium]